MSDRVHGDVLKGSTLFPLDGDVRVDRPAARRAEDELLRVVDAAVDVVPAVLQPSFREGCARAFVVAYSATVEIEEAAVGEDDA